jgi:hypothetical protein
VRALKACAGDAPATSAAQPRMNLRLLPYHSDLHCKLLHPVVALYL